MPWGILDLATTVGAQIANYPTAPLGWQSAIISFCIFPLLAATTGWMVSCTSTKWRTVLQGIGLGLLFSFALVTFNYF